MKWSLVAKIMAGYALALLAVLVIGVLTYRSTSQFMTLVEDRRVAHDTILHLESLLSEIKDAETGERGYVITGQDEFLQPYKDAQTTVGEHLKAVQASPAIAGRHAEKLRDLEECVRGEMKLLQEIIDLRKDDGQGMEKARDQILKGTGKKSMDAIRKLVGDIQRQEQEILNKKSQEAQDNAWTARATIVGGTLLAFVLLTLVGAMLARNISRPLNQAIGVLTATSSQIASAASQVAVSATESATAVAETTTTVAEVRQTASMSVQKAKHVADSARHTAQASQQGMQALEQMVAGINHIREQTEAVADSIVRLSEQSQAIGAIIATVDDLAAQSNLLAVNAAIEAAKAGEQGKGFAVVAQEVKSLAEQSKQATAQVRTILNDIQKATGAAVMANEQSSKAVEAGMKQSTEAAQAVRTLSDSIAESTQAAIQIAASSDQQLVGLDQLAHAMDDIKQASAQNAASTKQTEEAAANLTDLSRQLQCLVSGTER